MCSICVDALDKKMLDTGHADRAILSRMIFVYVSLQGALSEQPSKDPSRHIFKDCAFFFWKHIQLNSVE